MSLVIYMGKGAQRDAALALSKRVNAPISEAMGEDLTLLMDFSGLSLVGYGLKYQGNFEEMLHRVTEGRLQHELLVHTAKTKKDLPKAIDATAGMGEDALLLAASGYEVTLFERNPVVAALLRDALRRAKKNALLRDIVSRMQLVEGDSIQSLPMQSGVDLVYLDPMFPARQKSGKINKKLQLIQRLEQPCVDEAVLIEAAKSACPQKIIIKRPAKGGYLAGIKPHYSVNGKAIRYDCFVFPENARG